MIYLVIIHNKIHEPKCCSFAHCGGLCRLKMGEAEARHILIFICKFCNGGNCINKLFLNKQKCLSHCDNIGVIANIATCGAKVNDCLCLWAKISVSMHMAHNIVAKLLFICSGSFVIYILRMRLKLVYLLLSDIKAKFFFRLCKCNPKLSPCFKFKIGRINILHFLAGIA